MLRTSRVVTKNRSIIIRWNENKQVQERDETLKKKHDWKVYRFKKKKKSLSRVQKNNNNKDNRNRLKGNNKYIREYQNTFLFYKKSVFFNNIQLL